jgi:hypothetical protein
MSHNVTFMNVVVILLYTVNLLAFISCCLILSLNCSNRSTDVSLRESLNLGRPLKHTSFAHHII